MALGKKTGGRTKGVPNKVTADTRLIFKGILERLTPEIEAWLREAAQGIEIEKQMPDGQVVVGRFNADPAKATDILLKIAEFCIPKLQRVEKRLEDCDTEELVLELRRRLNGSAPPELPRPEVKLLDS